MLAIDQLLQQLHHHPTESIILAAKTPPAEIQRFAADNQRVLTEVTPCSANTTDIDLPHRAFAVVTDYLEHLDKTNGLHQLGHWRNLHCNHMWIAVPADNSEWHFADFISLGCKRLGQFACSDGKKNDHLVNVYGYDLGHYNHRRQWNNSRYWANPEMWSKRW